MAHNETDAAPIEPLLFSVDQTCRALGGIGLTHLRELVRRGELDGRKIGRRLVVTAASARRYAAGLPRAGQGRGE